MLLWAIWRSICKNIGYIYIECSLWCICFITLRPAFYRYMITFWRPLSIGFFWDSSVTRKRQTKAELLRTLPWHEASALRHETVPYLIAAERATYLLQDRARRDRTVCARRAVASLWLPIWLRVVAGGRALRRSGARCLFACVEPSAVLFAQHPEEPRQWLWVHLRKEESRQKSLLRPPRPS